MRKYVFLLTALVISACATTPKAHGPSIAIRNMVRHRPHSKVAGEHNYVIWNKRQFLKPRGLVTMSQTMIFGMAKIYGAHNMRPLKDINGFTIKHAKKALSMTSDEWVVQEEVDYHIVDIVEIKPYLCPATGPACTPNVNCPCTPGVNCPVNGGPKCPGDPSCPVNPGGTPETARSWGVDRIHALQAKTMVDTTKVVVGICDTGIDLNNPNNPRIAWQRDFTGKGSVQDGAGHGTHVAGTIAGKRGTGIGVSEASVAVGKGLDDQGSGSSSTLSSCLAAMPTVVDPVTGAKVKVVSNSWGSSQSDPMINAAIASLTAQGIAVVVANGNDSRGALNWPAALSISNAMVFGIAASDQSDQKASFSSYGTGTKFIAPGVNIVSNAPGGGWATMSGTSMATPHVAGSMAYCIARNLPVTCIKTDNLNLQAIMQGAGLPNLLLTVQ